MNLHRLFTKAAAFVSRFFHESMALTARLYMRLFAASRPETGQTIPEYAILIAVIAIVVLAAATLLGKNISSVFSSLSKNL